MKLTLHLHVYLFVPTAAQARGLPSGQSVGLWWSSAEGLVHTHIYTTAGQSRLESVNLQHYTIPQVLYHMLSELNMLIVILYAPLCVLDLTQAQQAVLVEILVASVRQASEGPVLAGRSGAKKVS